MNKNKVSDMAKDFGLTSKDILSVLSTYEDGSKTVSYTHLTLPTKA